MSLKAIVNCSAWVWRALALRRAVIVLLHLGLLLPLASLAEDAILERAYLEDASGTLTWDDVMQAPGPSQSRHCEVCDSRG